MRPHATANTASARRPSKMISMMSFSNIRLFEQNDSTKREVRQKSMDALPLHESWHGRIYHNGLFSQRCVDWFSFAPHIFIQSCLGAVKFHLSNNCFVHSIHNYPVLFADLQTMPLPNFIIEPLSVNNFTKILFIPDDSYNSMVCPKILFAKNIKSWE